FTRCREVGSSTNPSLPLSARMENTQPLDPRLNATEITELANLNTQEVTIKIPKITRSDADSMVVSSEHIIFEEMDYANVPMTAAFCVGDCVLKVNNDAPQSDAHFKQILADLSPCTVVVSRRSFVIAPGELRLRKSLIAMNLPYQKGFSYQVVCCKKQSWDRFLTTSFGFLAEDVVVGPGSNKFIIGEINTNTAAEKYFSVGDGLIDFKGTAIKPGKDPNGLKQFNATFQQGGDDMEVLIERPVSKDARNLTEGYIKKHLLRHDTPAMSDDAINIGINAALYHHMFWRRLTSVSILVKPPPIAATPAPTKKKKVGKTRRITKTRTKEDATAIEGTNDGDGDGGLRITLEAKKNFQEISTDVADGTELETVGYRYSSEGEDDDEKEDKEDDDDVISKIFESQKLREIETEKKKSPSKSPAKKPAAPAAPAAVAAAPAAAPAAGAKKADSKRKRGLFSSLPFIRLKK
ncbi:hypothetical protein PENTCL1PPCAC_12142, partial [Pristionchus entomophagus]